MTLQKYEYAQVHMGVQARVVFYAKDQQTAEEAARAAFHRVAMLEDVASDYRPTSEAMLLCAKAGGPPVPVSDDLFILLQKSIEVSQASNGGFDVTVGPLVALWRQARKTGKLPPPDQLEQARKLVGYQNIKLDPEKRTAQLLIPGMKLDFGGIAKGYAGDLAIAIFKEHGITSALFEFGGDIVLSDPPPGTPGWIIGVTSDRPTAKPRKLFLANCGVSTSGDTEQFVIIDGKRYSHVVDPHTGLGTTDRALVTVIAPHGLDSDPLDKAAAFMGPEFPRLAKLYPQAQFTVRHMFNE